MNNPTASECFGAAIVELTMIMLLEKFFETRGCQTSASCPKRTGGTLLSSPPKFSGHRDYPLSRERGKGKDGNIMRRMGARMSRPARSATLLAAPLRPRRSCYESTRTRIPSCTMSRAPCTVS
ncbi:MAG: hypothetical protein K1X78_27425 [Verrucomicrobiaceae bacterium]|nr:hypothetical protein [Verrucomicrobiaceae bacterium]